MLMYTGGRGGGGGLQKAILFGVHYNASPFDTLYMYVGDGWT